MAKSTLPNWRVRHPLEVHEIAPGIDESEGHCQKLRLRHCVLLIDGFLPGPTRALVPSAQRAASAAAAHDSTSRCRLQAGVRPSAIQTFLTIENHARSGTAMSVSWCARRLKKAA